MDTEFTSNAGDTGDVGSIPGSGRSPGGGQGNPLQYSCLENLMVRGAHQATAHGITKSRTQLKQQSTHTRMHAPSFADKCKAGDSRSYSADTTCKDLKVSKVKRKEYFPGGPPTLSTQGPSSFQQLPGMGALWPPVLPLWRLVLSREPGR